MKRVFFRLLMILFAVVVIELVGYAAYRLTTTPKQRELVEQYIAGEPSLTLPQLTTPHPYSLYQPAPGLAARGFVQHNSHGFRGPELRTDPGLHRLSVKLADGPAGYATPPRSPSHPFETPPQ